MRTNKINKPLFDSVYQECCEIIQSTQEQAILNKKRKLDFEYKQLFEKENPELQKFYSIVHELRTYDYLVTNGFNVTAQDDNHIGPDFMCEELGYIECISITKGKLGTKGRNYVDSRLNGPSCRYSAALPRITNALVEKRKKYEHYLSKGAVDQNRPRIIAVSTSVFSNVLHHRLLIDLSLKILYGIGAETMRFQLKPYINQIKDGIEYHQYDDKGKKCLDLELKLDYFSQNEFKIISAVIIENNALCDKIENKFFNVLINPFAKNPVDTNRLKNIRYFALSSSDEQHIDYKWFNLPL